MVLSPQSPAAAIVSEHRACTYRRLRQLTVHSFGRSRESERYRDSFGRSGIAAVPPYALWNRFAFAVPFHSFGRSRLFPHFSDSFGRSMRDLTLRHLSKGMLSLVGAIMLCCWDVGMCRNLYRLIPCILLFHRSLLNVQDYRLIIIAIIAMSCASSTLSCLL